MRWISVCLSTLWLTACHSVEITPDALRRDDGRSSQRVEALARWEETVGLINEFLASSWRLTLPAGRFALGGDGMRYTTDAGCTWHIAVLSTTWGDLVVATGFRAQEDADGFVVGSVDPASGEAPDALLDNTFFRWSNGEWHGAHSLAELILHETTHVVFRDGTVGAFNTLGYYAVAVVTFSAADHPAEDRPRATSEEYAWFRVALDTPPEYQHLIAATRDEHLAVDQSNCEHGPFEEPECP